MPTVITFGTFDLFHFGHLRILQRAADQGDRLVVGVSSDMLNWSKKQERCAVNQEQRMAIIRAMRCVHQVFLEESLEEKARYCKKYGADVLVMGDDHLGEYDEMCKGVCRVQYMPRTKGVSSSDLKRDIASSSLASSLTALASKGKPETENVAMSEQLQLVQESLDVSTKPLIYDGGTGGHPEIFHSTVRALENLGVSACILEDKTGLKQNGTDQQESAR
jgi:choline-phosphate cytidylyltransferase